MILLGLAVVMMVMTMRTMSVVMCVIVGADAADVVMMPGLGRSDLVGIAEDLRAVLAELAIHDGVARADLLDAVGEGVEDAGMVAQIGRLDELDAGELGRDLIGFTVDP